MKADLILTNGRFHTLAGNQGSAEPAASMVFSLAVKNGRILALGGPDHDLARDLTGPDTEVIDLQGRTALPGFNDSHVHFFDWAISRAALPLARAQSKAEAAAMTGQAARQAAPGQWLTGRGLDEKTWPENSLPTRWELDEVAPKNPVMLFRRDMHMAAVNSAALALAGVTETTVDPPGGAIDRDDSGRPTGLLRDLAMNLVQDLIPLPEGDALADLMAEAQAELHTYGVTGLSDLRVMGGPDGRPALHGWQHLHTQGRLALRAWVCLPGEYLDQAVALGLKTGFGDDFLRLGHLKFFVDGSMGARTAWTIEPYLTGGHGLELTPIPELEEAIVKAHGHGLAVTIHAIGDKACQELTSAFESALARASNDNAPPARHRIEHVQMIRPEVIARLGRLGVTASIQPLHVPLDISAHETGVGDLCRHVYPFADLDRAGVDLACGSDCPVSQPKPLWGLAAAVTRTRPDGSPSGGWYPNQALSLAQALAGYTTVPARVTGRSQDLGSLAVGKLADLAVLSRDIFKDDAAALWQTEVDMTLVNGQVVHRTFD